MAIRASGVTGTVGAVALAGAVAAAIDGHANWGAALFLFALALGWLALRRWWGESVEQFEDALDRVTHKMDSVDAGWRVLANAAAWPPHLRFPCPLGLLDWAARHANHLPLLERTMLAYARAVYAPNDFREQPFHADRRTLRRTADFWARQWRLGIGFRRFFHGEVLKKHRADLTMLAYLEIACAERLQRPTVPPDTVSEWAGLAEQWPGLKDHPVDPSAALAQTASGSYLDHSETELGEAVVRMAFRGSWGRYVAARQLVEKGTLDEGEVLGSCTELVTAGAMRGVIVVRGRRSGRLNDLSMSAWYAVRLTHRREQEHWRVRVEARPDKTGEALDEILRHDAFVVDSVAFQKEWPAKHPETDAVRRSLLETARRNGVDATLIARLSGGSDTQWFPSASTT